MTLHDIPCFYSGTDFLGLCGYGEILYASGNRIFHAICLHSVNGYINIYLLSNNVLL
ncbi:protein of unknown function [Serratia sp. Tan611]|nr:protein of unknown function [Serratia sp. Tan611]